MKFHSLERTTQNRKIEYCLNDWITFDSEEFYNILYWKYNNHKNEINISTILVKILKTLEKRNHF